VTFLELIGNSFATACAVSILLTVIVRQLAPRLGVVAIPKADRWHRQAIPLLGGIAVWGGVTAVLFIRPEFALTRDLIAVYAVGTLLFGVGLVDDLINLKPGAKLTAQIAIACLGVLLLPDRLWTGLPAGLDVLLMIVWIVGITNAFNLLDNMDGVCAGVAVIAAMSYSLTAAGHPEGMLYATALAGAAAGFLLFNFQPASIFLGDSGSLFIGASFGMLALAHGGSGQGNIGPAVAVPVLVLLLPIFDTLLVTLTRKLSARSASVGGRDHTSHRLVALGFSERQTALLLYGLAVAGGGTAAAIQFDSPLGLPIAVLLLIGLVLLGVTLSGVRVYGGQDFALLRNRSYTPLLVDVAYKRRLFEIVLDVLLVSIAYYLAYIFRFDDDLEVNRPLFVQSLPIVIACQLTASFLSGLYRGVWRYIGLMDLRAYAQAVTAGTVASVLLLLSLFRFEGYSRGVFVIYAMTVAILLVGSRLSFRLIGEIGRRSRGDQRSALIYGAGDAGVLLVRELVNNPKHGYLPVGFVDDDPATKRRKIHGVKVVGSLDEIETIFATCRPDVLIISTHKITPERVLRVQRVAAEAGVLCRQFEFRLVSLFDDRPRSRVSAG
jgi:UDP-GlcNAc:undecaprenyl-phosphate GlcNAc-1-phosphate transferase